jgi:hypothetical protein
MLIDPWIAAPFAGGTPATRIDFCHPGGAWAGDFPGSRRTITLRWHCELQWCNCDI